MLTGKPKLGREAETSSRDPSRLSKSKVVSEGIVEL